LFKIEVVTLKFRLLAKNTVKALYYRLKFGGVLVFWRGLLVFCFFTSFRLLHSLLVFTLNTS